MVASNTILIINTITKHSGLKCLGLHVGFGDFQETIPAATGLELNIRHSLLKSEVGTPDNSTYTIIECPSAPSRGHACKTENLEN